MKIINIITRTILIILFYSSTSFGGTDSLIKKNIENRASKKIKEFSGIVSDNIANFTLENFENVKYLDFGFQIQEQLKPTFNIMSVNELTKIESGTIFNQISLNTHDDDETINIGLGVRKLISDNKILLGSNIFYDHQFDLGHTRTGVGVETISSIFDLRGNYYNAISNRKTNEDGNEERALDGWDLQADYHLHKKINVLQLIELDDINIFVNAFDFKNPEATSDYREIGNKYGINGKSGHWFIEVGHLDDNQDNNSYFANISFVVKLGKENKNNISSNSLTFTDVSDKLYQPVKRENKIRVVKILKSGVQVSGF